MTIEKVDIKENRLLELDKTLLDILLKDNTTKKNLIWATDAYRKKGKPYESDQYILAKLITGYNGNTIKPRVEKSKKEQQRRARDKAEVFTPSWVCNAQNNLIDNAWFGSSGQFNMELSNGWKTNYEKIEFPQDAKHGWNAYVKSIRLEITCGEAPYMTSRYDTVTGNYIEVDERIGFLDRKLRVVSENVTTEQEWIEWAIKAVKASYGYDWQGDNVFLARENVLYTVMEFYEYEFCKKMALEQILEFAKIIAWNIWQMDGLKFVVPNSCCEDTYTDYSFFGETVVTTECVGCQKNDYKQHNGIYCTIKDWQKKKVINFMDLIEEGD